MYSLLVSGCVSCRVPPARTVLRLQVRLSTLLVIVGDVGDGGEDLLEHLVPIAIGLDLLDVVKDVHARCAHRRPSGGAREMGTRTYM